MPTKSTCPTFKGPREGVFQLFSQFRGVMKLGELSAQKKVFSGSAH